VAVANQELKVLIPRFMNPGDSFIHTPPNGQSFTVIVPENAKGGQFISIIQPDEVTGAVDSGADSNPHSISCDNGKFKISKAAAGAALVGGVVGACVLGPIGAVALAGGAAYCTTRTEGRVGSTSRDVGSKAYDGAERAKNWVVRKVKESNPTPDTPEPASPITNR
jgi:hypothetical protein